MVEKDKSWKLSTSYIIRFCQRFYETNGLHHAKNKKDEKALITEKI